MPQEVLPPENKVALTSGAEKPWAVGGSRSSDSHTGRRGFRMPVGIALGLVFSVLLVAICGIIITYMAASDRRIAGRLLDEQGVAVLKRNETVLQSFFQKQELLFRAIAIHASAKGDQFGPEDLNSFVNLLPEGARFTLQKSGSSKAEATGRPDVYWSVFEYNPKFQTGVKTGVAELGNGQVLLAHYPQPVFSQVARNMVWEDRQKTFLLSGKDKAIVVDGLPESDFEAKSGAALPDLASLTGSPLHLIWKPQSRAHDMGGFVSGRVFPGTRGMFTAIYTEIETGPAKGWYLGTLYQASQFGAALDQTRIVLYAALVALVVGALLSFMVGRMLGKPLIRLAHSAAGLRQLEFAEAERLPRSRLSELDDVNQAFNGSIGALNAFAKYVPRQLVSRLIEEGMTDTRNIEVREMTIIFTDLAGFTNMASHLSAEETATYLNGYFETVSNAIAERDGTIDKFLGGRGHGILGSAVGST